MRLFVVFGSLLVLVLLAALIVPPYVDWNQFKTRFEREASLVLGQPVKVLGQTSARLLPLPSVTFTNVQVGGGEGRQPVLTAQTFHIDVELAPLLKGDVVVVEMALDKPNLDMNIDENGRVDWASADIPAPLSPRPEFSGDDVLFENISITNGQLRLRDTRVAREFVLKDVVAKASARTLAGPWRVEGFVSHEGSRARIKASTGRWSAAGPDGSDGSGGPGDGRMSLKLTTQPQNQPYDFEFDGPVILSGGMISASGRGRVKPIIKQGDKDRLNFQRPGPEEALQVRAEGDIELNNSGVTVQTYQMEIGARDDPYTVTGSAKADFGESVSFKVVAEGQQINIERLVGSKGPQDAGGKLGFEERFSAVRSVLEKVPRFDADGLISLYLPAVVAGDTVVREVGMDLRPLEDGQGWQISDLEAQLPGRTDLRANGALSLTQDLRYEGELILASRQPSGFAAWLGADADPAIRALSSAGFSANATMDAKTTLLDNLEISLDGKTLKGRLRRDIAVDEKRPKLIAELKGERVDYNQLSALLDLFSFGGASGTIGSHDLVLDLATRNLSFAGARATDVTTKMSYTGGRLAIETLSVGDIRGANLQLSGNLAGFPGRPDGLLQGRIISDNPVSFIKLLASRTTLPDALDRLLQDPVLFEATDVSFKLKGEDGLTQLSLEGQSGGSLVDFYLNGFNPAKPVQSQAIETKLTLNSSRISRLLAQLNLPVVPLEIDGRGGVNISASGVPENGLKTVAVLTTTIGEISLGGQIVPTLADRAIMLDGQLNLIASTPDLDQVSQLAGIWLPGFGQGYAANIGGRLTFAGDTIELDKINADIDGSKITGALKLRGDTKPRPILSGELAVDSMPASLLTDLVFVPTGTTGATEPGTRNAVLAGLDGVLGLRVGSSYLPNGGPVEKSSFENVQMELALRDGDVAMREIKADWLSGSVTGAVSLANTTAARLANGQLQFKGLDFSKLTKLLDVPDVGQAKVDLNGSFETAGTNIDGLLAGLTGSGTARLVNGRIRGLDAGALRDVLEEADKVDDEKVMEKAGDILKAKLFQGETLFDKTEMAFSITSGQLRANNFSINGKTLSLVSDLRYNFANREINVDSRLSLNAGDESVTGATPELAINFAGQGRDIVRTQNAAPFATFLGLRANERREREFEAQRSAILERQRLLRTARIYALKEAAKRRSKEATERAERLRFEVEKRRREEADKQSNRQAIDAKEKEVARQIEAQGKEPTTVNDLRKRAQEAAEKRLRDSLKNRNFLEGKDLLPSGG